MDPHIPFQDSALPGRASFKTWKVWLCRFLYPLKRFWWIMPPVIAAFVAYEHYKIDNLPVQYTSSAKLKVAGKRLNIPDANLYQEYYVNFFTNQLEHLKDESISKRARIRVIAKHPEYTEINPNVRLRATHEENSMFFNLSATGSDQKYTQLWLDGIMETFLSVRQEERSTQTEASISMMNAEIGRLEKEIRAMEDEIQAFLSENNMVFIQEQAQSSSSRLVKLHNELADLEREYRLIERYQKVAEENNQRVHLGKSGNAINTQYASARQKLEFLRAEQARFSKVLRPEHPKMLKFEDDIHQQKLILKYFEDIEQNKIDQRQKDIGIQVANLKDNIEEWKSRAVSLSEKLAIYERLNAQLERLKKRYDQHLNSLTRITSSQNISDQEIIKISQRATPAKEKKYDKFAEIPKAAGIGFAVAYLMILVVARWKETIYTEGDLPVEAQMKLIAQIPRVAGHKKEMLLTEDDKRHAFVESFRNLRSYLLLDRLNSDHKEEGYVVCVTSAIPSEGKSTISSNLSVSLALAGYRTLLIDADMRQGNQHKQFNAKEVPGLSELLSSEIETPETIHKTTAVKSLNFMSRGKATMNSSEYLLNPKMAQTIKGLRQNYDFIIIDTPPVLATDDVANLLPYIDRLFMVARLSLSTTRTLKQSLEMLHDRKADIAGYVLNSCGASSSSYYKYRYYDRYAKLEDS